MSNHPATAIPTAATHSSGAGSVPIDLAATIHTASQAATVALIVTIVIGVYLLSCLIWPFGKCRRCKGAGKFKSPFGRAYRQCGKCDASGLRVRLGRHVINHLRAVRGAGKNSTTGKGKN